MARQKRKGGLVLTELKNRRPFFITALAWILIIYGLFSAGAVTFVVNVPAMREQMAHSRVPVSVQSFLGYISSGVWIISGVWMLHGANWSRWLCLGFGLFSLISNCLVAPSIMTLLVGLLVFIVFIILLLCEEANAWFTPKL